MIHSAADYLSLMRRMDGQSSGFKKNPSVYGTGVFGSNNARGKKERIRSHLDDRHPVLGMIRNPHPVTTPLS